MRLPLCAALLLLAGCASPTDPATMQSTHDRSAAEGPALNATLDAEATTTDPAPAWPVIVAALNHTSMEKATSVMDVTLSGTSTELWNASGPLGLPVAPKSLLIEMACTQTGGVATDSPGIEYGFDVQYADGSIVRWVGTSNRSECGTRIEFDADRLGDGELVAFEMRATGDVVTHEASYDITYAVSLLATATVPEDYSGL